MTKQRLIMCRKLNRVYFAGLLSQVLDGLDYIIMLYCTVLAVDFLQYCSHQCWMGSINYFKLFLHCPLAEQCAVDLSQQHQERERIIISYL